MPEEESINWKNKGDECIRLEKYEDAIKCYQNAVSLNPEYIPAWNNIGYSLSKLGRNDEAKQIKDKINEIKNKQNIANKKDDEIILQNGPYNAENSELPAVNNKIKFKQELSIKQIQIQEGFQKISDNFTKKSFGVLDSIGGAVKSGTRKISYNMLRSTHIIHLKKLIIGEFPLRELKNMCLYFQIGEPIIRRRNRSNQLVYATPTYDDWAEYALNNIELVKLKEYAKMHNKLPYKIIELEKQYKIERVKKYPEYEKDDGTIYSEISGDSCDVELLQELVNIIKEYRPVKPFKNELLYHTNLYTHLCEKIPGEIGFEVQRGSSRPDIVVGDIAIEIKGPTDRQGLITIADKINRYSKYFGHTIVVLFDVEVYERYYYEWYEGIIKQYQNQVTIIRK